MSAKQVGFSELKSAAPIILVVCVGAFLSVLAFFQLGEMEASQRRADFDRLANDQTDAIHAEITATLALLRSLRGLFTASETVTRDRFRAFVRSLEVGNTVQALEWIPRVPDRKRADFERRARDEGYLDFQFTERQSQGVMAPAGQREEYFPVYFIEPLKGNSAAVGFDLGSNPARLAALRNSGDSGELVASSRITLVQEKKNQYGFLVFVPVYRDVAVTDTVEDRRRKLIGFGLGVYRIGDLIEAALPERRDEAVDFRIMVFDESASSENRLLYPRGAEHQASLALESPLGFTRQIDLAGRTWSVLIVPTAGSAFAEASWQPTLVLLAGLLFTILAFLYLNSIRRRFTFAQNLVEERTAELKSANQELEQTQAQLQKMALHDSLTGLANRKLFQDQLEHAVEVAKRLKRKVVLLMIDLDGFKEVNDMLGHQAGDEVLREVARRLQAVVRSADLVSRLGGDEFVIIMESGATSPGAMVLARKIGVAIAAPIDIQGVQVTAGASVGIAVYPEHANDGTSLTHHADAAMYRAKKNDELFAIYNPEEIALSAHS